MTHASGPVPAGRAPADWVVRIPWILAAAATLLLLVAKAVFLDRININWDEFYFLTHVHSLERGELQLLLQGAYTHLFTWLTALPGNEIDQVIAARMAMFVLLVMAVALIWALAREWVGPRPALVACLAFLALSPVLRHGASFRSDSLIVPLILLALLALARHRRSWQWSVLAGIAMGFASALTVKAVLFAPLLVCIAFLTTSSQVQGATTKFKSGVAALSILAASATVTAVAILIAHKVSLPPAGVEAASDFAVRTARKTLLNAQLLPQWRYLRATLETDWLIWWIFAAGFVIALLRRQLLVACSVLALLPVLFYRNAFPYFYVVMLAPLSVLAALAAQALYDALRKRVGERKAALALAALVVLMTLQALPVLGVLRVDDQERQRLVVEAVHRVFPQPIPYIDHSGMIASFPKANFFMSTWGVDQYKSVGVPFMPEAIRRRAALMVANRSELVPRNRFFYRLLPEDQRLIEATYIPYWGAVWVAGTRFTLAPGEQRAIAVTMPGRYRLRSADAVVIEGTRYAQGEVCELRAGRASVALSAGGAGEAKVELVWAEAREPPPGSMPLVSLYSAL